MKREKAKVDAPRNMSDVAILFLRMFIGGVVLLHIIGKLQTYDNVIISYRHILGFGGATSFAIVTILEGLFAAMIMVGVATRFASSMMIIVSAMAIAEALLPGGIPSDHTKLYFVYMGIYLTLTISGGGAYSFHVPTFIRKNVLKR
ncbi:MAG: DoxX family protein [Alistipes sp.]|nr:DoxX family protein [Alistipes sp.]